MLNLSSSAGAPQLVALIGSAAVAAASEALALLATADARLAAAGVACRTVTIDPRDLTAGRVATRNAMIAIDDRDRSVSVAFGACAGEGDDVKYAPCVLLLDRRLQVVGRYRLVEIATAIADVIALAGDADPGIDAPVLTVPRLFEPELCGALIAAYEGGQQTESGFMRDIDGRTTLVMDASFKRRRDHPIEDARLRSAIAARVHARLVPAIKRAFQFDVTRIERYMVAAYDADSGGYFRPHRDNTTHGTAHRRFAVTINLNSDYDGGDLRFPEFGTRTHRAPEGGAVVFSCSLQHEATRVTRGRRYACLPFLYDDAAAAIRAENQSRLAEGVPVYSAGEAS
ncbi:2OG-Fe(II) oxygenase [Sphingomonas baiyangensis]|uniref:2OG-Fe(II) oxygenase n=2 Tax=Sphingomonas baiyangensis TaxID=2572576 RepID=A0A4U1L708_9SPHN|nr:2OG-Fe(II) oxygenase [Sphingomonas baiyangensis]